MDAIQKNLLEQVAGLHEIPEGAYNIRSDGQLAGRNTTANIDIISKQPCEHLIDNYFIFVIHIE